MDNIIDYSLMDSGTAALLKAYESEVLIDVEMGAFSLSSIQAECFHRLAKEYEREYQSAEEATKFYLAEEFYSAVRGRLEFPAHWDELHQEVYLTYLLRQLEMRGGNP